MNQNQDIFKVAAAQASPVFLNKIETAQLVTRIEELINIIITTNQTLFGIIH